MKPWKISLILFAGSLVLTGFFWMLGLPFFFLLLFIPLIPLFTGSRQTRRCLVCGWETSGSERFCPYDASPLAESVNNESGKK